MEEKKEEQQEVKIKETLFMKGKAFIYNVFCKLIMFVDVSLIIAAVIFSIGNMIKVGSMLYCLQIIFLKVVILIIFRHCLLSCFVDKEKKQISELGYMTSYLIPAVCFYFMSCVLFSYGVPFFVKKDGKIFTNQAVVFANPWTCDEIFYLDSSFSFQQEIVLSKNKETIIGDLSCNLWWKGVPKYIIEEGEYNGKAKDKIEIAKDVLKMCLVEVFQDNFVLTPEIWNQTENIVFELKGEPYRNFNKEVLQEYSVGWNGKFTLTNIRVVK